MKLNKIEFLFAAAFLVVLNSCKKPKDDPNPDKKGKLSLDMEHVVGNQALTLNSATYQNAAGEDFNITMFNYYVSNVSLVNENGTEYLIPQAQSYFLIRENINASKKITVSDIPEGNYTSIRFLIGVDSLRSTMDISQRTGVLDPAGEGNGMYWMWNSGYIFVKFEGTSPASPQDGNVFKYHIGGFGGYNSPTINNIRRVELSFGGEKAEVREMHDHGPEIHMKVDAAKILNGTTNVSIANNPVVMFSPFSVNIANNYVNMFSVEHVHND